jgi:hypothetical protein
VLRGNFED